MLTVKTIHIFILCKIKNNDTQFEDGKTLRFAFIGTIFKMFHRPNHCNNVFVSRCLDIFFLVITFKVYSNLEGLFYINQ